MYRVYRQIMSRTDGLWLQTCHADSNAAFGAPGKFTWMTGKNYIWKYEEKIIYVSI